MIKIIVLVSALNLGDVSNAESTIDAIKAHAPQDHIEVSTIDTNTKESQLVQTFVKNTKNRDAYNAIIAIGDNGLNALKLLNAKNAIKQNTYIYWSGHQFFDALKDYKALGIDHIMLPSFTIDNERIAQLKTNLVNVNTTFGVPTKFAAVPELKKSYDNWDGEKWGYGTKPLLNKRYIIVTLPGDAPDVDGKIKLFTKKSAHALFDDIRNLYRMAPSSEVVVQNGPRTGKYDSNNQVICTHEYSQGTTPQIDSVTEYFISLLSHSKMKYTLHNFAFELDKRGKKTSYSTYNPLLYVALNTDSYYVIPGESVSQISQFTTYIKPEKLVVFESDSMNSSHQKLLGEAFALGYLSKFHQGHVMLPKNITQRSSDYTHQLASDILRGINTKCSASK